MARPTFQSQTLAMVVGGALVVAGFYCLYDAWERRGVRTPIVFRSFVPW